MLDSHTSSFVPIVPIKETDQCVAELLEQETKRQQSTIGLIASENHTSAAVRSTMASTLTNKYAEGYPGKRYYAGCQVADEVEKCAIQRAQQLFGMPHVNVQPHAGSQANMAAFLAALQPGDTILGMGLIEGGHLTHGHRLNFSGQLYNCVSYGVDDESHRLDYHEIARLAEEHKPKLIIAGASAYTRTIDFERFAQIARSVNALLLADIAHIAGLVATKLHPSPVGYADFITSTTHKTLRGPRGGLIMCTQEWAEKIDRSVMPGSQGGPFMHTIAAKAVAFGEALNPSFREYQQQVISNAQTLARELQTLGYQLITGGTDNHLLIVDLRIQGITGQQAQHALEQAGIITSKSCIPNDPQKPWVTSGIRIGTPAITTRGATQQDMKQIAHWIDEGIRKRTSEQGLQQLNHTISRWSQQFLVP